MQRFEVKKTKEQWHFVLKARNGEVILSSEMYNSEQACMKGIEAVKEYSQEHKCFDMRKSEDNKHYFVLKASNGEVIGVSETYETKAGMLNGIDSVMRNNRVTPMELDEEE